MDDKAPVAAPVVDVVRVPAPEVVVGATIYRVVEVVRPGVHGQLIQKPQVEPGSLQQRPIGRFEDRERPSDHVVVSPHGCTGTRNEQRDRPHPFVGVGLEILPGLQDGHGPMAEEVVQPA